MNMLPKVSGLGAVKSMGVFCLASAILFLETNFLIPYLAEISGYEKILIWFFVAGLGMFLPMLIVSYIIIRLEGYVLNNILWKDRLRFKKISKVDLLNSFFGLLTILVLSFIILQLIELFLGAVKSQPPFMEFEPLSYGRYWILAAWFPYWILNIMGEEIFWRGVILPKQEITFGKFTWIIHGTLWGVFHIAFGWHLLFTLLPILYIQAYLVQKQKNTWVGVIIHAGVNGPGFLAISLGLI